MEFSGLIARELSSLLTWGIVLHPCEVWGPPCVDFPLFLFLRVGLQLPAEDVSKGGMAGDHRQPSRLLA